MPQNCVVFLLLCGTKFLSQQNGEPHNIKVYLCGSLYFKTSFQPYGFHDMLVIAKSTQIQVFNLKNLCDQSKCFVLNAYLVFKVSQPGWFVM